MCSVAPWAPPLQLGVAGGRRKMMEFVGAKPLSLIFLTAHMDLRAFYPEGWMRGWEEYAIASLCEL